MTSARSPIAAGLQAATPQLVLASRSKARASMLAAAGVEFAQKPADLDESSARAALMREGELTQPGDIAELLAITKSTDVSSANPDAVVIGADQVLALGDQIFAKPEDFDAAQDQLLALRGKTHTLHTAVSLCRGGQHLWSHVDTASLTMRQLSPEFIGRYLSLAGVEVLGSVGAYHLEGPGAQLFSRVDGDYFTVLGLPLLPLLTKLREMEVLLG